MSLLNKIFGKTIHAASHRTEEVSIFDTHNNKIYPWIKVLVTDDTPAQFKLKDGDCPISKAWLGDLAVFYVVDIDNHFQILLERDLPKEMTREKLHQLAVDNLSRDIEFTLHEANFGGYGLVAGGNHEAGSICLPAIWEWIAEYLNDNLIVAIPAKDLVLLIPERDTDKITDLKKFVDEIFKKGERLLSRDIFRFNRETKEWTLVDTIN